MQDPDRTASLMTPAQLAEVKPRPPVSAAAWLDQMAADAGHAHVRRLAQLQEDLQAHARGRDIASLAAALAQLGQALPQLDFGLLAPQGWWARTRGKSRGAAEAFAGQLDRIDEALGALAGPSQLLRAQQQPGAAERALLELDVESRALDKMIDQGTRWLHDMRIQLKARQAASSDAAGQAQIERDSQRCELLVDRLKALRAVTSAAQLAGSQAKGAAGRRVTLMRQLQQTVDADVKNWRGRVSAAAASAAGGDAPVLELEAAMESHRDLQLCVKKIIADCAQLRTDEQALTEQLGVLGTHLHAAS